MKKLLISALALAMGVTCAFGLAACGDDEVQGMTDAEIANSAVNNLKVLYSANSVEETPRDYQVLGKTKVKDDLYDVTWTVSAENNDISDYITVGTMDEDYMVTISVTRPEEAMEYTLTASVTVGEATASYGFKKKVPAAANVDVGDRETTTASITFDAACENRTEFTTEIQVWEQNGIKVTGLKGSGNDIANYGNPARFYKGATVKIEYPGMKHLEIDSVTFDDNDYAGAIKTSIENANIPATITVTEGDLVIDLDYAMDSIEFTASAQLRMYALDIVAVVGGAWDADKVAVAKATASIGQTTFSELGQLELPAESYGASFTWSVKETTDLVSIADGKLSIDKLPEEETQVTLVAAIECGEANDTAEVVITLLPDLGLTNDGTIDHPFTTTEALAIAGTLDANTYYQKDGAPYRVYVQGYVSKTDKFNTTYNNWEGMYIASDVNGTDEMQVYRFSVDGTVIKSQSDLVVGSYIVVYGYLQNFRGSNYQVTYSGSTNPVAVEYQKADGNNPGTDPKPTESKFSAITAPVAGEYVMAMDINGTWYYLTGELSGNYAASATNVAEAAKIELIEDGDGWLIKANGKYVEIIISGTYNNIKFNDERATDIHWVWNAEHSIFTWTNTNGTLWVGTYNTFTTFSASKISYITNSNQYPAKLGTLGEGTGSNPGTEPGDTNYGTADAPLSVAQALALAAEECANENDVTAEIVYMTGVVTDAGTFGGTYYSNMHFADADNLGTTILAYTINLNAGVAAPVVGDTLVIYGYIKNYNGTLEFASNNGVYVYILSNDEAGERIPEQPVEGGLLYTLNASGNQGSNNGYANNCDIDVDGITWNVEGNSQIDPWRFGGKSITDTDRKLTSKTALSGKVTKLVIKFGASNITVNSVTLVVYSSDPTQEGATVVSTMDITHTANGTVTVEADADWSNCYYQIIFNVTNSTTSNKYVTVSTMEFYADEN